SQGGADVVEGGGDRARQFQGFSGQHPGQLAHVAGADEHARHPGPVPDPGQRHRQRGGGQTVGGGDQGVDDTGGAVVEAAADLGGGGFVGAAGVCGHPVAVFSGEDAAGQRCGGDQAGAVMGGGGHHIVFGG